MDSIFGGQHWDIDFEIYDGVVPSATGLLYGGGHDGAAVIDTASTDALSQRVSLDIAGHRWLFVARWWRSTRMRMRSASKRSKLPMPMSLTLAARWRGAPGSSRRSDAVETGSISTLAWLH
jgi:hypothetical protein